MAQTQRSILLHQLSGQIGKQVVIKRYGNKTVVSAYPDMSRVKPSERQLSKRERFAAAVAYAHSVMRDPVAREVLSQKLKKGQRLFNAAIREYLEREGEITH